MAFPSASVALFLHPSTLQRRSQPRSAAPLPHASSPSCKRNPSASHRWRLATARRLVHVGDGARHAERAHDGAPARMTRGRHVFQERSVDGRQAACIARAPRATRLLPRLRRRLLPRVLPFPRTAPCRERAGAQHPLAQRGRRRAAAGAHHLVRRGSLHVQMQVDTVHERAADARLVRPHLRQRARARALPVAEVATGTGVRGRHQHEPGGERHVPVGTRDADPACLQGLAQALQHGGPELGQLVQEQDAVVGKRYLARPRRAPTADEPGQAGRVVRAAERPVARQNRRHALAGDRMHERRLQGLVLLQGRKDGRQARGEHGLARTRRAAHQHAVIACGRYLQRAFCRLVARHVAEIGHALLPAQHAGARRLELRPPAGPRANAASSGAPPPPPRGRPTARSRARIPAPGRTARTRATPQPDAPPPRATARRRRAGLRRTGGRPGR